MVVVLGRHRGQLALGGTEGLHMQACERGVAVHEKAPRLSLLSPKVFGNQIGSKAGDFGMDALEIFYVCATAKSGGHALGTVGKKHFFCTDDQCG